LSTRLAMLVLLVAGVLVAGRLAAESPGAASAHAQRMADLGYKRYRGSWRTSQEISLIERADATKQGEVAARQRLERLRRELDRGNDAVGVAEQIRQTDDPLAVPALTAAVASEPQARVRLLYVEALGSIGTPDAIGTLVTLSLDHADGEVRHAATEQLAEHHAVMAVPPLIAALAGPDNGRINRAATALGRLGDPRAVEPLIAALVTSHTTVAAGNGGKTSVTFTPGSGGLALGGGPKAATTTMQNRSVLEALTALTDVNFSWNVIAWRQWLAAQGLPPDTDLRRDP
jgi:HEAT repeat protein